MKMNLKGKMKIGNAVPTAGLGESNRSTMIFMVGTRGRGRIWLCCGFIGCDPRNNERCGKKSWEGGKALDSKEMNALKFISHIA